jgi:hypothetical protein
LGLLSLLPDPPKTVAALLFAVPSAYRRRGRLLAVPRYTSKLIMSSDRHAGGGALAEVP